MFHDWCERPPQDDMIYQCRYCRKYDQYNLADPGKEVMRVPYSQEKANQTYFQDVDAGEQLLQRCGIQLTACVVTNHRDVKEVMTKY